MHRHRGLLESARCGGRAGLGWYNVLPFACRARRASAQAFLSVKDPRQSSGQIPLDYRNIWTDLDLIIIFLFPLKWRGSNQTHVSGLKQTTGHFNISLPLNLYDFLHSQQCFCLSTFHSCVMSGVPTQSYNCTKKSLRLPREFQLCIIL